MPAPGSADGRGQRFGRSSRLRVPRDFQRVARRGRRASSSSFVVVVAPREGETASRQPAPAQCDGTGRLGLTVSRRVGGAVVRNRVKRRVREWFRRGSLRRAGALDWVVIARPTAPQLSGRALREELDALGRQALARVAP